jgi:FtsH-binding integral membrane protein
MFSLESILFIFALTGLLFGIFSLLGFYTNIDLSKFSTIFFMGLFGIIIASIINIFIGSTTFELVISWIAIALFVGMTAYDIQKIKRLSDFGISQNNLAIIGAFELYLDFINIFINLLRLFGNSRD